MTWDNDTVIKFIRLYKSKKILWDPTHTDYYNKVLKNKIWTEMGLEFGVETSELKRKMEYLMAALRRERMKLERARRTGHGRKVSPWYAYNELLFLLGRQPLRSKLKSLASTNSTENSAEGQQSSQHPDATIPSTEDENDTNDTPMGNYTGVKISKPQTSKASPSVYTNTNDECQMFANYVACKLRSYSNNIKNELQHEIINLLYLADVGELNAPTNSGTQSQEHKVVKSQVFQNSQRSVGRRSQGIGTDIVLDSVHVSESIGETEDIESYHFVIKEERED